MKERNESATMQLDIVSAEKQIFSGTVEMVVATGELGELGIVPGHTPLLTTLSPGEIRITMVGGQQEIFYVSGGLLEVQPWHTTVIADVVERANHLNEAEAEAAKARAEEIMKQKSTSDLDYSKAAAELAKALAQIRAIQKLRKMKH